ncbi:MAG: hypothetical protein IT328_25145 [Caldilineaceae bacterium]|nr:hypothetical protein [Caldilineaceae bacterium]
MQLYIALALTAAALVAWFMALRLPAHEPDTKIVGLSLVPLAASWLVALLTPAADNMLYKGAVVLGLLLALLALALRQSNFLPGYAAHAHLLITYALYALAFSSQTSGWPTPFALILIVIAGLLYYWLFPSLAELWSSVAVYALLLFLATWQALELAVQQPSAWIGWAALAGMLLATIATLLEAQARFRTFRPTWAAAALPLFLIAQLAIAWSVWG